MLVGSALVGGLLGSACGGGGPIDPALPLPEPSVAPGPGADYSDYPGLVMLLSPQGLPEEPLTDQAVVPDVSGGNHDAITVVPEGAPLINVEADNEVATQVLSYPEPCDDPQMCLRPILEVADARSLNPGVRDFTVMSTVRVADTETSAGSNIVQKGFSTGGGGQWKLQVDGEAGIPTCTIVQPGDDTIHIVEATISISDGAWHDVACRREGDTLTVAVDGEDQASVDVPDRIDLLNEAPVRVGGKNSDVGNDPFHGDIAQVVLIIG